MKKVLVGVGVLVLAAGVYAVGAYAPSKMKPLSADEKMGLRAAQVAYLQANNALHASREWAQYQVSQQGLDAAITKIYGDRKIDQKEWTLCDGPGAPGCDGVAKGDIELAVTPKPAAKVEEKK